MPFEQLFLDDPISMIHYQTETHCAWSGSGQRLQMGRRLLLRPEPRPFRPHPRRLLRRGWRRQALERKIFNWTQLQQHWGPWCLKGVAATSEQLGDLYAVVLQPDWTNRDREWWAKTTLMVRKNTTDEGTSKGMNLFLVVYLAMIKKNTFLRNFKNRGFKPTNKPKTK